MRDFLFPFLGIAAVAATPAAENPLWERLLEKWGIAFIGIFLLWRLAKYTSEKEAEAERKRNEEDKEDKEERKTLLAAGNALQARLLEVQTEHIATQTKHATKLEQLTKDNTTALNDNAAATRMLLRKMKRPCVLPFESPDDEKEPK